MKNLTKITTVALVMLLALNFMACSSYGKLEKAFLDNGYKVEVNSTREVENENDVPVTVHMLSKGLTIVVILEFRATEDMIEFYKGSNTMQGVVKDVAKDGTAEEFYKSLVEMGYANGNCLAFSLSSLFSNEVQNIVKNA